MTVIYLSEEPGHAGFGLAKCEIGDKVRVTKITLTESDQDDTRHAFLSALGNTFEVEEVNLWESNDPQNPWHVTYEIQVGKHDSIFLNDDEITVIESAAAAPVEPLKPVEPPKETYPAAHPMGSGELY